MFPYAVLNSQFCDKYHDCPAAKNCPHGAIITYPEDSFGIDLEKCAGCDDAQCQNNCNLFYVAHNDLELHTYSEWIKNDPRDVQSLKVERFSADIVWEDWHKIEIHDVESFLGSDDKIKIIEIVNPQRAVCLYQTIPMTDIIGNKPFRKIRTTDLESLPLDWGVTSLPVILVFKGATLLGKREGRIGGNNTDLEKEAITLYDCLNKIIRGEA